jgi:hypothetical protein
MLFGEYDSKALPGGQQQLSVLFGAIDVPLEQNQQDRQQSQAAHRQGQSQL